MPGLLHDNIENGLQPQDCTTQDLKDIFFYLLRHALHTNRYFILIDGLDEFADNQQQLVKAMHQIAELGADVRLCCSSRPEPLFRRGFGACRSLRLQDLTHGDMMDYCDRQLGNTKAAHLGPRVIEKADGIFLWLYLVVNDLRLACEYDTPEELEMRLEECPEEMAGLFSIMLKRCDRFYIRNPKSFLKLINTAQEMHSEVNLLILLLADLPPNQLLKQMSSDYDDKFLFKLQERVIRLEMQVTARTAGITQFFWVKTVSCLN